MPAVAPAGVTEPQGASGKNLAEPPADTAAAVPAAAEAAVIPAAAPDWPGDDLVARSQPLAWGALYRAWGLEQGAGDPCRQAARQGLRCRSARGGLDELRRLDRPAVLELRNGRGQAWFATLTGIDDGAATVEIDTESRKLPLEALGAQWSGQYVLLWRLPPEASETLRAGDRGPAVAWLARQLAKAQGRTIDPGRDAVFDEALVRQVRQFQLAQGLIPDGAVGPQTLVRIAGIGDDKAPRLRPRASSTCMSISVAWSD